MKKIAENVFINDLICLNCQQKKNSRKFEEIPYSFLIKEKDSHFSTKKDCYSQRTNPQENYKIIDNFTVKNKSFSL